MKNKTRDYNSINWNEIFIEDASSSTGLRWKIKPAKRIKVGDVAGHIWTDKLTDRQCFIVGFNKTVFLVHRILYVMRNGEINSDLAIDHIDGNSLNNSADNLRLVSAAVNSRNQKQHRRNSSGVTGVGFYTINGYTYAITSWYNLAGNLESKQFSCAKLGLLPAFAAACAYREKMIAELNAAGAGYSDRHGE